MISMLGGLCIGCRGCRIKELNGVVDMIDIVNERMTQFIERLPVTRINVVYLCHNSNNNTKFGISVKDILRVWTRNDDNYYIYYSGSSGTCYMYIGSDMIKTIRTEIDKREHFSPIGHHLSVRVVSSKGRMLMKNHHTRYDIDEEIPSRHYRNNNTCYILLDVGKEDVLPLDRSSVYNPNLNIRNLYDKKLGTVIQDVSRVYYGSYKRDIQAVPVRTGEDICSYKSISFSNNDFLQFITDFFVQPLVGIKQFLEDLEEVTLIYDEGNELDPNGDKYIVVIYDSVEVFMHYCYLEARKAFRAFYAYQNKASANEEEKSCLQELLREAEKILAAYVM